MGKSYRIPTYSDALKEAEKHPDDIAVRQFFMHRKGAPPRQMYQLILKYTDYHGNERTKTIAGMSVAFAELIKNSPKLDAMQAMMVNAHRGRWYVDGPQTEKH
tara:strand:+ start:52 stop:360 length:309 start_codon:yes stop_codon:yes gene_type:complete